MHAQVCRGVSRAEVRRNKKHVFCVVGRKGAQETVFVTPSSAGTLFSNRRARENLTNAREMIDWGSSLVRRGVGCPENEAVQMTMCDQAAARAVHLVGAAFLTPQYLWGRSSETK